MGIRTHASDQTMTICKSTELSGRALDWAVAEILGYKLVTDGISQLLERGSELLLLGQSTSPLAFSPSTPGKLGSQIIEDALISLIAPTSSNDGRGRVECITYWTAQIGGGHLVMGPTAFVAAMRCFVLSKRGATVDVPSQLLG